jgi:uncharacterized protein (DUF1015 family)
MVTPQFSNKTAIFDAGSRVYFHANSGLIVAIKAHYRLTGVLTKASLENEVILKDRLEAVRQCSRTMGAIWLTDGSTNNSINHLTIKKCHHRIINSKQWWYHCIFKNTQIYNSTTTVFCPKPLRLLPKT